MAARFVAASTQYLVNSAVQVTAAPFTVGLWFNMPSGTDQVLWSLNQSSGNTNFWGLYRNSSGILVFNCSSASAYAEAVTGTAITSNAWEFVILRAISAANRRIAVWHATGAMDHAQNTTSVTPASINTVSLGAPAYTPVDSPMTGKIAGYWMTNSDIQPGGAQLDNGLLCALAQYGPMAVPHVRNALIEYLPLVDSVDGGKGDYYSSRGRRTWTNVSGVQMTT